MKGQSLKPFSLRERAVGLVIMTLMLSNIGTAQAMDTTSEPTGLLQQIEQQALLEQLEQRQAELDLQIERAREQELRLQIVAEALTYVGRVGYVLTGSTPSGWDCSGFTRYVFEKFGHGLEHSARKQKLSGMKTDVPRPGDLVAFERGAGVEHIGIYVGDGVLVEATVETGTTRVVDIGKAYPEERGWKITYVNVLSDGLLR